MNDACHMEQPPPWPGHCKTSTGKLAEGHIDFPTKTSQSEEQLVAPMLY